VAVTASIDFTLANHIAAMILLGSGRVLTPSQLLGIYAGINCAYLAPYFTTPPTFTKGAKTNTIHNGPSSPTSQKAARLKPLLCDVVADCSWGCRRKDVGRHSKRL